MESFAEIKASLENIVSDDELIVAPMEGSDEKTEHSSVEVKTIKVESKTEKLKERDNTATNDVPNEPTKEANNAFVGQPGDLDGDAEANVDKIIISKGSYSCHMCNEKFTLRDKKNYHIKYVCPFYELFFQYTVSSVVFSMIQKNKRSNEQQIIDSVCDVFNTYSIPFGEGKYCLYGFGYTSHENAMKFRQQMAHRYVEQTSKEGKERNYHDFLKHVDSEMSKIEDQNVRTTLENLQKFLYFGICKENDNEYDIHGSQYRLITHIKESFTYLLLMFVNKKCGVILNCGIVEDLIQYSKQSIEQCARNNLPDRMFIATCFKNLPENVAQFLELCCIQSTPHQLNGNSNLTNTTIFNAVPIRCMKKIGAKVLLLLNKSEKLEFNPLTFLLSIYSEKLTPDIIRAVAIENQVAKLDLEILSIFQYSKIDDMRNLFEEGGHLNTILKIEKQQSNSTSTFAYNTTLIRLLEEWTFKPAVGDYKSVNCLIPPEITDEQIRSKITATIKEGPLSFQYLNPKNTVSFDTTNFTEAYNQCFSGVLRIIKNNNILCPYCGFDVQNSSKLQSHMSRMHISTFEKTCYLCKAPVNMKEYQKHSAYCRKVNYKCVENMKCFSITDTRRTM